MLKLVFYTGDRILRVRHPFPEDSFQNSFIWNNKIQFILTKESRFTMTWISYLPDMEPIYAEALVDIVGARYPVSGKYPELKKTCPELVFQTSSTEWVFFGGSFNPWHKGHQSCLELLPEDKLCLILPDRNPFKENRTINPVASILELSTIARFKKNQFLVPSFLMIEQKNPTCKWIKSFKETLPGSNASLLMGFDNFSQLKTWTNATELLPMLKTVYVASRLEEDEERLKALDEAHALNYDLDIVFLGRHHHEDYSSTKIRNSLK